MCLPLSGESFMSPVCSESLLIPAASACAGAPGLTADDRIFRDLVVEHRRKLHDFIARNIGQHSDAEDLTQQAFVEAARSIGEFRGESALSTWLYGIAMNLVRNYLSRAPHRRFVFEDQSVLESLSSQEAGPQEHLERRQMAQMLFAELEALPREMRDVLLLVAVDDLSYEQAATLLSIPVGTVKSRVSRTRATLRARLDARGLEQSI
jgi:RNA polymerase sigma factor (sigma-70 family)